MKLKLCFPLIVGLILTSCSLSSKELQNTYNSERIKTEIQTNSALGTETETYTDMSIIETTEPPVYDTDDNSTYESDNLSYISPDGKYAIVLVPIINEISQDVEYNTIRLKEIATDTEIISSDERFYDISVEWSPDGQYAAVRELTEDKQTSNSILLFDASNGIVLSMPRLEIQNRIYTEVSDTVNLYSCDLLSCEWADSHTLKVDFDMKTGVSFYNKSHLGFYTFDLESGSITTLAYDTIEENTPSVTNLTEDEMKAVINENLDILMSDSDGFYSEKEFIDAHPDAFENIIALADVALPYLNEIADENQYTYSEDTIKNCLIAKAAAYVIKPDIYDVMLPSPDEKYKIIATRAGFSMLANEYQEYNDIRLLNCLTGLTEEILECSDICVRNIDVEWSSDSQYAAISFGMTGYNRDIIIVDVKNKKFHKLPTIDEIKHTVSDEDPSVNNLESYYRYVIDIDDWLINDNEIIQFVFALSDPNDSNAVIGYFTYDLIENKILNIEAKKDSVNHIPSKLFP